MEKSWIQKSSSTIKPTSSVAEFSQCNQRCSSLVKALKGICTSVRHLAVSKMNRKATNLFSNPRCCELFRSRFWRHLSFQQKHRYVLDPPKIGAMLFLIPMQQFSNSNKGLFFGRKKHTPGQLVIFFFIKHLTKLLYKNLRF